MPEPSPGANYSYRGHTLYTQLPNTKLQSIRPIFPGLNLQKIEQVLQIKRITNYYSHPYKFISCIGQGIKQFHGEDVGMEYRDINALPVYCA